MEPSNNRASIDADLSICHMCGEPAARWAQVLVRTVGVCRDHAAGPAAAINAIPAVIDGEEARAVQAQAIDNAAKVSDDYEDDGGRDDEYMVDVYAEAASMIETGWPKNRAEMERALAEAFEHGEIVIDGGVARVTR